MGRADLAEPGREHRSTGAAGKTLHRAPWVVTGARNPLAASQAGDSASSEGVIEDGAVLTAAGRILETGRYQELKKHYPDAHLVDHDACILTPALVNAHAHLELSHLAGLGRQEQPAADLAGWIRKLIAGRDSFDGGQADILAAGRLALDRLHNGGVGLVGDIGNEIESGRIGKGSAVQVMFFLELIALSAQATGAALARLARDIPPDMACSPHAPYSTSGELICRLKKRATAAGAVMTIHVAETADELEFLRTGGGRIRDFLAERSSLDESFTPFLSVAGQGAVDYLDTLGVLDAATLCVHAVHVSPAEIALLATRRVKVCLCPGSNRFLGVGRAPVAALLAAGILPALGTDSLASNPDLDLWQEMMLLRQEHPGIAAEAVFAMATRGGAEALGRGREWGALAPGRYGRFLAVRYGGGSTQDLFEFLTTIGPAVGLTWIHDN